MKFVCDVPMTGRGLKGDEVSLPAGKEIFGTDDPEVFRVCSLQTVKLCPPTVAVREFLFRLNHWDRPKLTEVCE